ncbi:MAG TPA: MerR family transcriptional regulator [Jiangellaceae bacterium]
MFSIGEFARHGQVSVRMLRHYDAIGLLQPERVDDWTGYRWYTADQLPRLNRIVALKDLGFRLEQIRTMLDDKVSVAELRTMLTLRHTELETEIEQRRAGLAQIEARLQIIEREGAMPTDEVQIKQVPAVRVAELTATATSFEPDAIGPVISPLFDELCAQLDRAGIKPTGPSIAYYEDAADGGIVAHAAFPVADDVTATGDFTIVELPEIDQAATLIHRGPMDDVMPSVQAIAQWLDAHGYKSAGYNRELYLNYGMGDPSEWVTELQEPIKA